MKVHPYLHLIQSAFRTYLYTSVLLTANSKASTLSIRALSGLPSDSKTVMIANTRWIAKPAASIIEQKGPQSARLPLWLAVWQCISTTTAVAATAPRNNCWLGSWSQLLDHCQQPVCSTPLIYVHWRQCKVVEKLYGITAPFACQATAKVKWVRGVRERQE